MEIVYFVLGVVTVLFVLGVVGMVKVGLLTKELQEKLSELKQDTQSRFDEIIETSNFGHIHLQSELDQKQRDFDFEIAELQSKLDSRLDKLENKLTTKK